MSKINENVQTKSLEHVLLFKSSLLLINSLDCIHPKVRLFILEALISLRLESVVQRMGIEKGKMIAEKTFKEWFRFGKRNKPGEKLERIMLWLFEHKIIFFCYLIRGDGKQAKQLR